MDRSETPVSFAKVTFSLLYVLAIPVLMLALSGDWHWGEGRIFSVWFIVLCYRTIFFLYRNDPALLAERFAKPGSKGQSVTDQYIVYALVIGFLLWILLIPLDAKRFAWTGFPYWVKTLGAVALGFSYYFFFYSYKDNRFLSPLVRTQKERNQQIVESGVYSMVRHPMYLGATLFFAGSPMLMGSAIGLTIGLILIAVLVYRIRLEEELLQQEFNEYAPYQQKVPYRLIPFIW